MGEGIGLVLDKSIPLSLETDDVSPSIPTVNRSAELLKIQETLAENILLKRELRDKLEHIVLLRNQLQEVFQRTRDDVHGGGENRILELEEGHTGDHFQASNRSQGWFLDDSGDAHLDFSRLLAQRQNHSVHFEEIDESEDVEITMNRTISQS